MNNYKKIVLAIAATFALGSQAIAADKLRIGTEGATRPSTVSTPAARSSVSTSTSARRCAPR